MKVKRRWLVLDVARRGRDDGGRAGRCLNRRSEAGKASGSITVWVDAVRLAGGEAYVKTHPNVQVNDRHLRRRRQRRDDDADEDPAVEPHRQGLAGRHLQRAGERPGLDGASSRSTSP